MWKGQKSLFTTFVSGLLKVVWFLMVQCVLLIIEWISNDNTHHPSHCWCSRGLTRHLQLDCYWTKAEEGNTVQEFIHQPSPTSADETSDPDAVIPAQTLKESPSVNVWAHYLTIGTPKRKKKERNKNKGNVYPWWLRTGPTFWIKLSFFWLFPKRHFKIES